MKRRAFLQGAGAAAAGGAAAAAGGDLPLEEASAADLARALAEGRASAAGLVTAYLERIEKLDRSGPTLRSVIELNPEAMAIAEALDRERRDGRVRGPLHGLPVLVKDNIASGDRMETSAGSPALVGAGAPRDAFVVQRLREAGAVLLGKTNLSEWANIRGKHSISGWSTRGGQTRNPYALDRSPSGSSSGSGAAMAASLAALAVGTETDGSITSPASCNGLVGVKPTVGLLSRDGIVPISFTQDTAGPMCRTVADAALLLAAMAGVDARDPATRAQAGRIDLAALTRLDAGALRGARLGVAENLLGDHVGTARLFDDTLRLLRDAGAVLVKAPLTPPEKIWEPEFEVLLVELQHTMPRYLAEFAPRSAHRSLADLVAFHRAHPATLALFGQEHFEAAAAKRGLDDPTYRKALAAARRLARTDGIDAALRKGRLDALVAPTCGPAWPIDPVHGDANVMAATTHAAVAGYPHVTVPMGQVAGLPVGLSFFAEAWSEARLLSLAHAFEQIAKARRAPGYATRVAV
jgi:amidase